MYRALFFFFVVFIIVCFCLHLCFCFVCLFLSLLFYDTVQLTMESFEILFFLALKLAWKRRKYASFFFFFFFLFFFFLFSFFFFSSTDFICSFYHKRGTFSVASNLSSLGSLFESNWLARDVLIPLPHIPVLLMTSQIQTTGRKTAAITAVSCRLLSSDGFNKRTQNRAGENFIFPVFLFVLFCFQFYPKARDASAPPFHFKRYITMLKNFFSNVFQVFVTLGIFQSQFIEKGFKKTEHFEQNMV